MYALKAPKCLWQEMLLLQCSFLYKNHKEHILAMEHTFINRSGILEGSNVLSKKKYDGNNIQSHFNMLSFIDL